jgi:hypothetical protein
MAFEDRIRVVVDLVTDKATSGIKSFRTEVAAAEGFTGKLRAGVSSLKDSFSSAAASPIAMGAAVGVAAKAGLDAVHAFESTAKAAVDLAAATGLSTEQASRWIGVGDDFQVTAEALTMGIGKIGKTLDGAQWDKYGIATHNAAGEARAANDILLDAFTKLSSVTNETQRAKEGNDLFGRGYAQLAPLIGHTRAEYEKMLGSVETGQVITAKEAAKAEAMRHAEDDLADAIKNLQLALGGLVADIAPVIENMAHGITTAEAFAGSIAHVVDAIPGVGKLGGVSGIVKASLNDIINPVHNVKEGFDSLTDSNKNLAQRFLGLPGMIPVIGGLFNKVGDLLGSTKKKVDDTTESLNKLDEEAASGPASWAGLVSQMIGLKVGMTLVGDELTTTGAASDDLKNRLLGLLSVTQQFGGHLSDATGDVAKLRDALRDLRGEDIGSFLSGGTEEADHFRDALRKLKAQWDILLGQFDKADALANIQDDFDTLKEKAKAAHDAAKKGGAAAEKAERDYQKAIRDTIRDTIDYQKAVGNMPDSVVTDIQAHLDKGDITGAEKILNDFTTGRYVDIQVNLIGLEAAAAGLHSLITGGLTGGHSTTTHGKQKLKAIGQKIHGATGGIVTSPTEALIGEAGPEAVIPLNQAPGAMPLGGGPVYNTFQISVGAGGAPTKEFQEAVLKVIDQAFNVGVRRRWMGQ